MAKSFLDYAGLTTLLNKIKGKFVDKTSTETIGGVKTFSSVIDGTINRAIGDKDGTRFDTDYYSKLNGYVRPVMHTTSKCEWSSATPDSLLWQDYISLTMPPYSHLLMTISQVCLDVQGLSEEALFNFRYKNDGVSVGSKAMMKNSTKIFPLYIYNNASENTNIVVQAGLADFRTKTTVAQLWEGTYWGYLIAGTMRTF